MSNPNVKFRPTLVYSDNIADLVELADPARINVIPGGISAAPGGYTGVTYISDVRSPSTEYTNEPIINVSNPDDDAKLTELANNGFYVPSWFDGRMIHNHPGILEIGKKYVIKVKNGARSIGKAIIDRETFVRMIYYSSPVKDGVLPHADNEIAMLFNEEFDIPIGHIHEEAEKYRLYYSLKNARFLVQEYVDIDTEYRVIYTNAESAAPSDNLLVFYRRGCQIGAGHEEDTYEVPLSTLPDELIEKLMSWLKTHPFPYMSLDVFCDTSGNWGIFEYSNEWSMTAAGTVSALGDRITDALLKHIYMINPDIKKIADYYDTKIAPNASAIVDGSTNTNDAHI